MLSHAKEHVLNGVKEMVATDAPPALWAPWLVAQAEKYVRLLRRLEEAGIDALYLDDDQLGN